MAEWHIITWIYYIWEQTSKCVTYVETDRQRINIKKFYPKPEREWDFISFYLWFSASLSYIFTKFDSTNKTECDFERKEGKVLTRFWRILMYENAESNAYYEMLVYHHKHHKKIRRRMKTMCRKYTRSRFNCIQDSDIPTINKVCVMLSLFVEDDGGGFGCFACFFSFLWISYCLKRLF